MNATDIKTKAKFVETLASVILYAIAIAIATESQAQEGGATNPGINPEQARANFARPKVLAPTTCTRFPQRRPVSRTRVAETSDAQRCANGYPDPGKVH